MFGPRPEAEQKILSFSSTVTALLWKASDALLFGAEDFYRKAPFIGRFLLVPDSLEQWAEGMQQRLLGYQEQANSFLSTSKNEFVKHFSSLKEVCHLIPEVLLRYHEQQHQHKLKSEMDRHREKLDQTVAASDKEKCVIVGQLRLCISEVALESLTCREQQRQQELNSTIWCSNRTLQKCLVLAGDDFVTSLASLTERLLHLFDLLITPEEIKAVSNHSENTEGEERRSHTGKRTWKGIPHFPLSTVTTATAPITTAKCTVRHLVIVEERDAAVKRFGQLYRTELLRLDAEKQKRLSEMQSWNTHWSKQIEKMTPN